MPEKGANGKPRKVPKVVGVLFAGLGLWSVGKSVQAASNDAAPVMDEAYDAIRRGQIPKAQKLIFGGFEQLGVSPPLQGDSVFQILEREFSGSGSELYGFRIAMGSAYKAWRAFVAKLQAHPSFKLMQEEGRKPIQKPSDIKTQETIE